MMDRMDQLKGFLWQAQKQEELIQNLQQRMEALEKMHTKEQHFQEMRLITRGLELELEEKNEIMSLIENGDMRDVVAALDADPTQASRPASFHRAR